MFYKRGTISSFVILHTITVYIFRCIYKILLEPFGFLLDSVRSFLKKNKLGKFSEGAQSAEERAKQKELAEEERSKSMKIGDRCEVEVPKQPKKLGTVLYIGNFISLFVLFTFHRPFKYFRQICNIPSVIHHVWLKD